MTVLALLLPTMNSSPSDFVPDDQLASSESADIPDPEFNSRLNRMVWQDREGNLWLANLDPTTGEIIPADGKALLLSTKLAPISTTCNGPEWVYGSIIPTVVYSLAPTNVSPISVAVSTYSGRWNETLESLAAWRPMGSSLHSNNRRILFAKYNPAGNLIAWKKVRDDVEQSIQLSTTFARWTQDGGDFFIALHSIEETQQVVAIHATDGSFVAITLDSGKKTNAIAWKAPEYPEDWTVAVLTELNTVAIYSFFNQKRIHEFIIPTAKATLLSLEVFVHAGNSYLVTSAIDGTEPGPCGAMPLGTSEIWIAGINPNAPFFRRVDSPARSTLKTEPEIYTGGPEILIYFNELINDRYTVRRARTGFFN